MENGKNRFIIASYDKRNIFNPNFPADTQARRYQILVKKVTYDIIAALSALFNNGADPKAIEGPIRASILTQDGKFKPTILQQINFNGENYSGKLRALLYMLDESDANYKKNREICLKSPLRLAINKLCNEKFNDFKLKPDSEFIKSNTTTAALACYCLDNELPIGIDIFKMISTLVGQDSRGKYYLQDNATLTQEEEMVDAICSFATSLQSGSRFKSNCTKVAEASLENER